VRTDLPQSDAMNQIVSFDWEVSYQLFEDTGGEVNFSFIAEDEDGIRYYSESKSATIKYPDLDDTQTILADLYKEISGDAIDADSASDLISNAEGKSENEAIELVVNAAIQGLGRKIDLIAAYHITYGTYFDNYDEYAQVIEAWLEPVKSDRNLALRQYIDFEINSLEYKAKYGPEINIEDLTQNAALLYGNRSKFINRHFRNKFGKSTSEIQLQEAISKLSYDLFGGPKVDFIYQLAIEELGPPPTYLPFISFTQSLSLRDKDYRAIALMFSLFKENINEGSGFSLSEAQSYADLSTANIIAELIQDDRFRSRFEVYQSPEDSAENSENSLNIPSESSTNRLSRRFGAWVEIPWFGMVMDKQYPWIFHADLGWMYSHGLNSSDIWFYSDNIKVGKEKIGWFWTNDQIFEGPKSAGAGYESQRFIFIVRKLINGAHVGSWALLDLETGEANPYGWVMLQE